MTYYKTEVTKRDLIHRRLRPVYPARPGLTMKGRYRGKRKTCKGLAGSRGGRNVDKENDRAPDKRLEDALLGFIERETAKTSPEAASISAVPAMAEVLVRLWGS